jgi:hypothetical protein
MDKPRKSRSGGPPIVIFRGLSISPYPIHRVMVNWDPPISQVIHLPGTNNKHKHRIPAWYKNKQTKNKEYS